MGSSTILRYQHTKSEQFLFFWSDLPIFRVALAKELDVRAAHPPIHRCHQSFTNDEIFEVKDIHQKRPLLTAFRRRQSGRFVNCAQTPSIVDVSAQFLGHILTPPIWTDGGTSYLLTNLGCHNKRIFLSLPFLRPSKLSLLLLIFALSVSQAFFYFAQNSQHLITASPSDICHAKSEWGWGRCLVLSPTQRARPIRRSTAVTRASPTTKYLKLKISI